VKDVDAIIHLGETVHITMVAFFEESQKKKPPVEIEGTLVVTG